MVRNATAVRRPRVAAPAAPTRRPRAIAAPATTVKPLRSEAAVLASWKVSLAKLSSDVLDRIIKSVARDFKINLRDPEERADFDHAVSSAKPAEKALYIMTFTPLMADNGIVAYLIRHSARWGIDVEPPAARGAAPRLEAIASDVPDRATRQPRATRTSAEPKPERTPRAARTPRATSQRAMIVIPGDVMRVCEMLGFRTVPDAKRSTTLKSARGYTVISDPKLKAVRVECDGASPGSAVSFVRQRLADQPLLNRCTLVNASKPANALDVPDKVVERLSLRKSRGVWRIS